MALYNTGTVSVTNGSATVTGSGTSWFAALQTGWMFVGPDGRTYGIASVDSATQITITPAYLGSNASGQSYLAFPTQSLAADLAAAFQAVLAEFQSSIDTVLDGKFPDGTVSAPAVQFVADPDTGIYRPAANQIGIGTGGVRRILLSSAAMQVDVPITGSAIQTDAVDNASGKILTAGAGGLLGAAPAGDDFDAPVLGSHQNSGQLTETEAAAAGLPAVGGAGSQNRWWQVQTFGTSTRMVQIATEVYGTGAAENGDAGQGGRTYIRTRHDATWDDWRLIYTQATVRGTVGQSGGVPTGALIERGSNANGEYVRFADGTQICWSVPIATGAITTAVGSVFQSGGISWTFPISFIDGSGSAHLLAGDPNSWGNANSVNATTAGGRVWRGASFAPGHTVRFQAVGRWF